MLSLSIAAVLLLKLSVLAFDPHAKVCYKNGLASFLFDGVSRELKNTRTLEIAKEAKRKGQALGYRPPSGDDDRFCNCNPKRLARDLERAKKEFKRCLHYDLKFVLVPYSEEDCRRQIRVIRSAGLIPARHNAYLDAHEGHTTKELIREAYRQPKHRSVVSYQSSHLRGQGAIACYAKKYAKSQGFCVVPLSKCLKCHKEGPFRGGRREGDRDGWDGDRGDWDDDRRGGRGGDRWDNDDDEDDFDKNADNENNDDSFNNDPNNYDDYDNIDSGAVDKKNTPRKARQQFKNNREFVNGREDIDDQEVDAQPQKAQVRLANEGKDKKKEKDDKEGKEDKKNKDEKEDKEGKDHKDHKHGADEKESGKEKNGASSTIKGGFGILVAVIVASILML